MINSETYSTLSLILIFLGVMTTFLSRNWRWAIGALGFLYLGAFVLVSLSWPPQLALVKLITGWFSCSVLALTQINFSKNGKKVSQSLSELIFWTLSAVLVIIISTSLAPSFSDWLPAIQNHQAWGGILIMGMGMLSLGFSNQVFRVVLSLLIFMAGFEIIYSAVEVSTLVAGLLAVVNLGIALTGAYLILNPSMEELPE